MQRLLNDATKISGVKYDMSNLADVYSAIHVIQEDLGVAGATAAEAATTFSGSFASMKSAAQNLLGNLAMGGDVTGSMEALIDSASTFLFDNAIPLIGNVITALPKAIGSGIKKIAPKLKGMGGEIATSLKEGLKALLPASMGEAIDGAFSGIGNIVSAVAPLVQQIGEMFDRLAPNIMGAFGGGGGFITSLVDMLSSALPTIESILMGLGDAMGYISPVLQSMGQAFVQVFPIILQAINSAIPFVMPIIQNLGNIISKVFSAAVPIIQWFSGFIAEIFPVVQTIFQGLSDKVSSIVGVVKEHMGLFKDIFDAAVPAIKEVLTTAWDVISPIVDAAIKVIGAILEVVEAAFPVIKKTISTVWDFLKPIFTSIADGLSLVGDAISGIASFVGDGISTIGSWFGFAYGKDRVPYDNYPAVLHEGEKVLTRNQADQYERTMSTRGVQLTQAIKDVPRDDTSGNTLNTTAETHTAITGGTNVTIEKLADTVVIEKEADVDKVVEDMVNKFRKLVPNMA